MLRTSSILYDLLRDKISNQEFYNRMTIGMVNPAARDLFKNFRDEDERHLLEIRKEFLTLESKAMGIKTFIKTIY